MTRKEASLALLASHGGHALARRAIWLAQKLAAGLIAQVRRVGEIWNAEDSNGLWQVSYMERLTLFVAAEIPTDSKTPDPENLSRKEFINVCCGVS